MTNKPADYGTRAAPYADFEQELAFYTKLHNGRVGRRTETARGQLSFDGVWAERLKAYAPGGVPDDLPLVTKGQKSEQKPRDVFAFFISGGKVNAPRGAMELQKKLG